MPDNEQHDWRFRRRLVRKRDRIAENLYRSGENVVLSLIRSPSLPFRWIQSMLYPELFKSLEAVRWNMDTDVPWEAFDANRLTDEQAQTVKMNAITEWAALPATEMFLRDNRHDSDFSAFMSVWFFEEQKHSLVLMEYLRRFRPDLVPT